MTRSKYISYIRKEKERENRGRKFRRKNSLNIPTLLVD